jgi:hypothetical protein
MESRQIIAHEMRPVIGGSIPQDDHAAPLKALTKILQKLHRVLFIPSSSFPEDGPTCEKIQRPIIRLAGSNIADRQLGPFIAFAPHITTGIAPEKMALIDRQFDGLFENNGRSLSNRFF